MSKLVLQPTETAQWHALVNDAQHVCEMQLTEDLESYLVYLLMRFTSQPGMAHSIMALDFLQGVNLTGHQRHDALRDVGDKCLLFSGLFPGRAQTRQVKISYFIRLGQSAYSSLSDFRHVDVADLFGSLCEGFVPLRDILQSMRELDGISTVLGPMEAAELWHDTRSPRALQVVKQHINSIPFAGDETMIN